jgi:hypothetical protein
MIWIILFACVSHFLYTKFKYKNWKKPISFHENQTYDYSFPYLQNVFVENEFYPLVIYKDNKTLFVSDFKSKHNLKTIKMEEID